jgi:hypothetical protein
MNKLRNYLIVGAVLLFLSFSDVSKYCRHQMIDLKFRVSALKASMAAPAPDIVTYPYPDDPAIMDFADTDEGSAHAEGMYFEDIDPLLLTAAVARMDSSDKPKQLSWEALKDVKYKKRYNEEYDQYFDYPVFGENVKTFEGQKVVVKGYIIPLDVGLYALSKYPYAACFFCGGAGPETITGLTFARLPKRYKTDEFLTLQGVFKLNDTDVNKFMYQLYAVEVVK